MRVIEYKNDKQKRVKKTMIDEYIDNINNQSDKFVISTRLSDYEVN